ncbi:MAG: GMC family oxidoreductase [Proteobacteria bacterium]|nr:GMC family oxidoreductase [Pseudomonadota bacterium]
MAILETDVVVAGTGPGGATLARELSRRQRSVVLLEKGRWHDMFVGRYLSVGPITRIVVPRGDFGIMARGVSVGGSTVVFTGNAYDPPPWLKTELGIDLSEEVAETRREIDIKPLPDEFFGRWPGTRRLVEAAGDLGIEMKPQDKYVDPDRCDPDCDDCMLGCRRGAKWTAREWAAQARANGVRLLDRTTVDRVVFENGRAVGLKVRGPDGFEEVRADKVVLAAGGMGTPVILLNSGVSGAGSHFFIDPMNVVWGLSRHDVGIGEQTFSVASEDFMESDDFMIGNLGRLFLYHWAWLGRLRGYAFGGATGMFAKVGDSPGGSIDARGVIRKTYTAGDRAKFKKGTDICKKIMIRAGVVPGTLLVLPNVGGHPGGTAAIGKVVGPDLQVLGAENLFVCDASVFPRSPGRPPSLTIIGLAKRLSKTL